MLRLQEEGFLMHEHSFALFLRNIVPIIVLQEQILIATGDTQQDTKRLGLD